MNFNNIVHRTPKNVLQSRLAYMFIIGVILGFLIGYPFSPYLFSNVFNHQCGRKAWSVPETFVRNNVMPETDQHLNNKMIFIGVLSIRDELDSRVEAAINKWVKQPNVKVEIFGKNNRTFTDDQRYSETFLNNGIRVIQLQAASLSMQKRVFVIVKFIHDLYLDKYSWFILLKDNVYLDIDKVQILLSRISASRLVYLESTKSEADGDVPKDRSECVGGSGIVVSQELFRQVGSDLQNQAESLMAERCVSASSGDAWSWDFSKFFQNRPKENAIHSSLPKRQLLFDEALAFESVATPERQYSFHVKKLKDKIKKLMLDVTQLEKEIRQSLEPNPNLLDMGTNSRSEFQWKAMLHPYLYKPDEGWRVKTKLPSNIRDTFFNENLKKYVRQTKCSDILNLKQLRNVALLSSYYTLNPIFSVDAISKIETSYQMISSDSAPKQQSTENTATEIKRIYQRQYFPTSIQFFKEPNEIDVRAIKGIVKDTSRKVAINFLVALSGRPSNFVRFLNNFEVTFLARKENVNLIVVFFPKASNLTEAGNDASFIIQQMEWMAKRFPESQIKLVLQKTGAEFSRGVGLQVASEQVKSPDEILFFCDVDLIFGPSIIHHMRRNTVKGKRVYYPVFFSQYDPNIVYANRPKPRTHFNFETDDGFWRYFSFGMLSIYKSDFLRTKGFNTNIHGWGLEDVQMYAAVVRASLDVFQSNEPAEVHIYHDKYCDPGTTAEQYRNCLGSRASHFGSKSYLYSLYQTKAEDKRKEELKQSYL